MSWVALGVFTNSDNEPYTGSVLLLKLENGLTINKRLTKQFGGTLHKVFVIEAEHSPFNYWVNSPACLMIVSKTKRSLHGDGHILEEPIL